MTALVLTASTVAALAVTAAPAYAANNVDLQVLNNYGGLDPAAMGSTQEFDVEVDNYGADPTTTLTLTLTATKGTIGTIDTSAYPDLGCTGSSTVQTCTTASLESFGSRYLVVPVTSDVAPAGTNQETVKLEAQAAALADNNVGSYPTDVTTSFTAKRAVAVTITHQILYDPDNGGGPTNPSNNYIKVDLVDSLQHAVNNEPIEVYERHAGGATWNDDGAVYSGATNQQDRAFVQTNGGGSLEFRLVHVADLGAAAATSQFTVAPRATRVKQAVTSASTHYGDSVTLNGSLVYTSNGAPVGYIGTVILQRRAHGSTAAWTTAQTVYADYSTGKFQAVVAPKAATDYRWHYVGQYFGAGSANGAPIEVVVHQNVATAITPTSIPPGGWSTLTTTVRPGQAGQKVALQHKTGTGWATIASRVLTTKSTQTWRFVPKSVGKQYYRVFRGASSTLASGTSGTVSLNVTRTGRGSSSSHSFLGTYNGHPISWDPCHVIHFRVNTHLAPREAVIDVKETLRRIHLAGGLRFHYDGTTSVVPDPYSPQHEDLIVAWRHSSDVPEFQMGAVGIGGFNDARYRNGHEVILHGYAILDADFHMRPGFGYGLVEGQLLMHELGHAMGLGHVNGRYQIMRPVLDNYLAASMYGAGDLTGLKKLGKGQGCF